MITRFLLLPLVLGCLVCVSCYSLPRQRGSWTAEITSQELYDSSLKPVQCSVAKILNGPPLEKHIPDRVILVRSDLTCLDANGLRGETVRLSGTILSDWPLNPESGKPVMRRTAEPEEGFSAPWILKVRKMERVDY